MISEIKEGPRGWLVLLIFAAGLHLATTTCVFVVGRSALMPSQFDRNGLGAFASDSFFYYQDVASQTDKLKNQGTVAWLESVAPLHVKSYSLSHFLFSRWTGPNILTIEPLNLFYYLAALALIYKVAETVFDRRTGLLAMTAMALWPSFLMHTTQLVRDPLLIVVILVFVFVITTWLTKSRSLRWSLAATLAAVWAVLTLWIVRLGMWDMVRVVTAAGVVLLVIRHLHERRVFVGPIVSALVLSAAILLIPHWGPLKYLQRRESDLGRPLFAEQVEQLTLWERIDQRRQAFANLRKDQLNSTASNIDNEVQFNSMADIIRYLPRAAALGCFAPFPNMWFVKGAQVGRAGRLLSGFETLITYLLEILALVGLWQNRWNLAAWLLGVSALTGVTALGLIVLNIGSLYRFRYPFLMLIVVLAAGGAMHILRSRPDPQRTS